VILVGICRLNLNGVPEVGKERHMRRSVTQFDLDRRNVQINKLHGGGHCRFRRQTGMRKVAVNIGSPESSLQKVETVEQKRFG
jgi:hypothetical protein